MADKKTLLRIELIYFGFMRKIALTKLLKIGKISLGKEKI